MSIIQEDWFLSLSEEVKLKLIEDLLKDGDFVMALSASKILLDAPISKGGVSTKKINDVFEKLNKD
tara:strand:- start:414 stop:611 length:198 start_codon:yes stop_codon:yes gene_type:complete